MSFPRPSTRAFLRTARQAKDYNLFDLLHGLIYIRFPYFYIGTAAGETKLARRLAPVLAWISAVITSRAKGSAGPGMAVNFADTYHGKVIPLSTAKQMVSVKQDIEVRNLETVIPYAKARDLILQQPDHITVLDCPCRVARSNPCLPLDVCLIIGEPFAGFVREHHPQRSRAITSTEAMEILTAEHQRGHVHHAFFKDAMLGRFFAICNCCDCCCGAMQAHRNGVPMLASSGYLAEIDPQRCQQCGTCAANCQFHAPVISADPSISTDRCMGCGVCLSKCPQAAITLRLAPEKGIPLDMDAILNEKAALP